MNSSPNHKAMKHNLLVSISIIGLLLSSYSHAQKPKNSNPIKIVNKFDEAAVKWFKTTGNASIKGVAKFKSKTGEVRFGKAFRIELMPYSKYTEERLNNIYKNKQGGHVYVEDGVPTFTPDPKGYHDTKKTMCDQEGRFEFNHLPAGDYYLVAFMLWDKRGGGIMRHVVVSGNETKVIKMTNF